MRRHSLFFLFLLWFSISNTKAQSNFIGSGIDLQFNGSVGNYVDLGDVFNTVVFPLTVEAWVNLQGYPPVFAGIFSTDNDVSVYYGFWFYYTSTGLLRFEFGDAQGAGVQFRRGVATTEALPLNKWMHVVVVANSATDIHMYFNGVEISTVPTDGGSAGTSIIHSAAPASIGRLLTPFDEHNFNGHLDEVRLWNITRTETEIRDFMCRKIDPGTSGLIGYWTADESYTSITVNDQTVPSENGTIISTVTKVTSGAPIGDSSAYNYTSNWNGVTVSISEPSGDLLIAGDVSGDPHGVHVYLVDSLPHDTIGLDTVPPFYFGVFCALTGSTAGYDVTYHYDFDNGAINANNESTAALFKREDGSVMTWDNTNGTLDMINNNISKNNETIRAEYILDVKGFSGTAFSADDTSLCEKFCIDFFDQSTNNPTSWHWIFNGGSPPSSNQQNPAQICYNLPGVYDVTLITSGANGTDTLTLYNYITVLETPPPPTITQIGYTLTSSNSATYQWQLNTVDITGATNQSYTVLQSGYYTVIVSNEYGCVNSFTVYILISGVDEIAVESISLFPNPAVNQINIDLSGIREAVSSLRITDYAGKVLTERKIGIENRPIKIDVLNFAAGLYFVEAITASKRFYGKFEVQK